LSIGIPATITAGQSVKINVTSQGAAVEGATIKIDDVEKGTTSNEGVLALTLSETGSFEVTAEKEGYVTGTANVEVISADDATKKLEIEVSPENVLAGNVMSISVKKAIGGEPVSGVALFYDGTAIGNTSNEGVLSYTPKDAGMHKIKAQGNGFLQTEITFEVKSVESMFKYSDLVIEPAIAEQGKAVSVSVNVSNTGTSAGEIQVELLLNGNVTDTQRRTKGHGVYHDGKQYWYNQGSDRRSTGHI
jgi:hypothetical protein